MDLDRPDDDEVIAPGDNIARSKLELEIENHVLSTTVKLSDGTDGPVFTRIPRNKDLLFGYSCHICGVVCLHGERMLQIHMAGRKHQARHNVAVFDAEQYRAALVVKPDKKASGETGGPGDAAPDQLTKEEPTGKPVAKLQGVLDGYRDGPLVGLEYIVELSEGNSGINPIYSCTLCAIHDNNEGDITTHMICLQHRLKFLQKHYPTVRNVLAPYRNSKTDRGAQVFCRVVQTVCEAIEDHHGRLTPQVFDRDDFDRNRVKYVQEIAFGSHFDERTGKKFVEVIDHKVLEDLASAQDRSGQNQSQGLEKTQNQGSATTGHTKRYRSRGERGSLDSISSISSANSVMSISSSGDNKEVEHARKRSPLNGGAHTGVDDRSVITGNRVDYRRGEANLDRYRASIAKCIDTTRNTPILPTPRELSMQSAAIAHERYKWEKYRCTVELAVGQLTKKLKEYEKSPEKHPLYTEEWKKFWNRRYKELKAEHKDPQKHNFKPEWIEFWTKRMKELHDEEVERKKVEIREKMQLPAEGEERTDELREQFTVRVPASSAKRARSVERKSDTAAPAVLVDVNSDEEDDDYKGGQPMSGRSKRRTSATRERERSRSEWERRSRRRSDSRSHRSRSPISDDAMDDYSRVSSSRSYAMPIDRDRDRSVRPDIHSEPVDYDAWARNYYGPNKKVFVRTEFDSDNVPLNFIAVCRLLTAFEEYLGSLGPKLIDLMAKALALEKVKANSADDLLLNEDNCVFLETVKEKLKGHMMAETIDPPKMAPIKKAVRNIARLLHEASKRESEAKPLEDELSRDSLPMASDMNAPAPPTIPSGSAGGLDKIAIAEQLAKALVAQGKVDFTTEELEQLINVYVAMEKMSRERKSTISTKAYLGALPASTASVASSTTASIAVAVASSGAAAAPGEMKEIIPRGLDRGRMDKASPNLGSAATRMEKNIVRVGASGSGSGAGGVKSRELASAEMNLSSSADGVLRNLSDSDLQTLLQNFKELAKDEQIHLISYLRKLERTEPERVDRLRRYVDFDSLNGQGGQQSGRGDYDMDPSDNDDRGRDYDDNDVDDCDFDTFRVGSLMQAASGRNQQPTKLPNNNPQKFNQRQQPLAQQTHHHHQQQQQMQPQQQQKQQGPLQNVQQQGMSSRQKELALHQQKGAGNKLLVDSEDEDDDYSYEDILRAATKNVDTVPHQSQSSGDRHDAGSDQSHRGNTNDAGGNSTSGTLNDTQNIIANLMESLQKSVSDASSNPSGSGTGGGGGGGSRSGGTGNGDYTNPITTIGVGRSGAEQSMKLAPGSTGTTPFYPSSMTNMQMQPRLQGPHGSMANMMLQQLAPYGAPQGPPLGQQVPSMVQPQSAAASGGGGGGGGGPSMNQMQMQQQYMYQNQMFGANGQQQGQQQQFGYGNFGYY